MIKLKDDNNNVVLREVKDSEMLADASDVVDATQASIAKATWKSASAWQTLANRLGECEVITIDGSVRGFIWPDASFQQAVGVVQKAKHPLWGEPARTKSCA